MCSGAITVNIVNSSKKEEEKARGRRRLLMYLYMKIPVCSLLMSGSVKVLSLAK